MAAEDRTVHASSSVEDVVRRSGKWYLEGTHTRKQITVAEAAYLAALPSFIWHEGMPGGRRFDALVRRRRKDLGGGGVRRRDA